VINVETMAGLVPIGISVIENVYANSPGPSVWREALAGLFDVRGIGLSQAT
jgi:hypothetical protein